MRYHTLMREKLAERNVRERSRYGSWQVEGLVEGSTRKVTARCLDCDTVHVVDLYGLRRKDRGNRRCHACSNRLISVTNQLPPRIALLRQQYHEYKKGAKVKNYEWGLDFDVFEALLLDKCSYCGDDPKRLVESSWDSLRVNGIDRVDNSLGYIQGNVVTACKDCNYAKRAMSRQEFIRLCERVAVYAGGNNRTPTGGL